MIIGTCSICGGMVEAPDIWGGVIPPTPTCKSCGVVAAKHGISMPVIPMWPAPQIKFTYTKDTFVKDIAEVKQVLQEFDKI